jgi:hydroxysqualene dehydroxylase
VDHHGLGKTVTPKPHSIAIIGGGYAGMAAAVRACERGARVTVFEAAPVLGGRARRIVYQDATLDNGQHILSGAYTTLLRLMDTVGLSSRVYIRAPLRLSMPPHFLMRAPLLPAPLHVAFALLRAKGLSWRDRFAAIRLMRALEKKQFVIAPDITVRELLTAHRQPENLIAHLWNPLTVSALNTPIERASAQVLANVLRDALASAREASDLLLPRVDLSALFPEPAAAWLQARGSEVRLGARITSVNCNENITLDCEGEAMRFDALILAVGPHQRAPFANLIDNAANATNTKNTMPETAISTSTFKAYASNAAPEAEFQHATQDDSAPQYEPIVTVYFCFDGVWRLPEPMLGQAHGIAQWFFDRAAMFENETSTTETTANETIIAAVISASGPHDALTNDDLVATVRKELTQHAPQLPPPRWHKVIREKFATFACTPAFNANRPTMHTATPRVYLAADDVKNPLRNYPATLEGAVRNGVAAADAAIDALSTL